MVFRVAHGTLNAGRSLCTLACTQGENYNPVRNAYYYCYYDYQNYCYYDYYDYHYYDDYDYEEAAGKMRPTHHIYEDPL